MCRWIEFPEFVEFFAEKLQPYREFTADGKNIDDVSAAAPGSLLIDARDALIAQMRQGFSKIFKIDLIPFAQGSANVA